MITGKDGIVRDAYISEDGLYRYVLHRRWFRERPGSDALTFIGLNPSVADGETDDPTIRRMYGFARREDFAGICVLNLFAFRSPKPSVLAASPDPAGPANDGWIARLAGAYGPVVAAWRAHQIAEDRARHVLRLLAATGMHGQPLYCLGVTASGAPRHPLYVRADQPLVPYPPAAPP